MTTPAAPVSQASDYLPGSIKRSPDWETDRTLAMRTGFDDNDHTNQTSWQKLRPVGGSGKLWHVQVAEWPDVPGLTLLRADQVVNIPMTPPTQVENAPEVIPAPVIPIPTAEDFVAAGLNPDGTTITDVPAETPVAP